MKPVAWMSPDGKVSTTEGKLFSIPLYTAPIDLSDEEIHDIWKSQWEGGNIGHIAYTYARAILKKASEPNTYKPKIVDMVLRTDNQGNVLPQKEIKESE
jgi:hypothetical protein